MYKNVASDNYSAKILKDFQNFKEILKVLSENYSAEVFSLWFILSIYFNKNTKKFLELIFVIGKNWNVCGTN